MNSLYKEEILEHYKDPQNFGKLSDYNAFSKQTNPVCGDEIEMFVKFEKEAVGDISFLGKGCAISIASVSFLTKYAKNKTKKELTKFSKNDMLELLGIEISQTRKKCALLGLAVLKELLE